MDPEVYDLLVVGGGTSGIVSARFYLDVHPEARIVVVERDGVVGGVWGHERVYEGFKSQAGTRQGGFSDVPFNPPASSLDKYDFFDAKAMAEYLEEYVDNHVYAGKTLRSRIRYNTAVTGLEKVDNVWTIQCRRNDSSFTLKSSKVIIASGITSNPCLPHFAGQDDFKGPIIHTIDWGKTKAPHLDNINSITVLGGGKSAADMVYQSVKAGKQVSWIIRQSGKGPGGFVEPQAPGSYRNVTELSMTRLFNSLMISGLGPDTWWSAFLFRTRLGQWLYSKFGDIVNKEAIKSANFDGRLGARESFKNLKCEMDALWLTAPAGMVHHEDFWDTIAKNVDIYRADIAKLSERTIYFVDGSSIKADAILLGTGFKDSVIPFFTKEQCIDLGLPHKEVEEDPKETAYWKDLDTKATKEVLARLPPLASPPSIPKDHGDVPALTPFRMYHTIAPLHDTSIAFIGLPAVPNMFAGSEIEAMWVTAYFDGVVKLPSEEEMRTQIAYQNAYMRLRVPTYGRQGNWYLFDYFPFLDTLAEEMGLTMKRKGWWAELTQPLFTSDLAPLRKEYLRKYGKSS